MMYCDNCKADFSDGMTYCKWCGQVLREKRLVTTQLQKCPSCSTPVQGEWTFCNVCGANILQAAQEPLSPICARCGAVVPFGVPNCLRCGERVTAAPLSSSKTPTKDSPPKPSHPKCAVCGEAVDADASYCKVCGAPIYSASGSHPSQYATQVHQPSAEENRQLNDPPKATQEVHNATLEISSLPTIESDTETVVLSSDAPSSPKPQPPPLPVEVENETLDIHSLMDNSVADDQRTAAVKEDTTTQPVSSITAPTDYVFGIDEEISFTIEPENAQQPPADATQTFSSTPQAGQDSWQMITPEPTKTYASFTEPPASVKQPAVDNQTADESAETRTKVIASYRSDKSAEPVTPKPTTDEFVTPPPSGMPPPVVQSTQQFQSVGQEVMGNAFSDGPTRQVPAFETPAQPVANPPLVEPSPAHVFHPPQPVQAPPFPSKKKKSAIPVVPLILILVILAGAGVAIWWFALRKPENPTANVNSNISTTANTNTANTNTAPTPAAPEGMVLVAAGTYAIGRDDGDEIEKPAHQVNLAAFYIDKTEVTNAEYKKFIDATAHPAPPHWKGGTFDAGKDNYPVVQINWQDATDYARWVGKRLPTEAEWEAAARGPEGRRFPWGNEAKSGTGNIGSGSGGTINAVGQFPDGKSASGAMDMIGNVWEWTDDKVSLYPGNTGQIPPEAKGKFRIIRGGAFDSGKTLDASYRGYIEENRRDLDKTGFRCVKDAN
jgi:formylglycine-generating enzyme required for sulfatase activity